MTVRSALTLLFLVFMPSAALSWEYPELTPANVRFLPVFDHSVHAQALVEAIDAAEPGDHVDMLYYLITADDRIGLPIMEALRRAANRNVHVRVLTSAIANLYLDRTGRDVELLADPTLSTPIEFIKFGGVNNWLQGLSFNDGLHEKIFIIRGPSGVKLAGYGGHNLDSNEKFFDLAFLVKPIDPMANHLGNQIWQLFEERRDQVLSLGAKAEDFPRPVHDAIQAASSARVVITSPEQCEEMASVRQFLASSGPKVGAVPGELRPARVQLFSNDVLTHARLGIYSRLMQDRATMPDDIEDRATALIRSEPEFYLASMIASFSPRLMAALIDATKEAIAHIMTNSRESSETFIPGGLAHLETLQALLQLFHSNPPAGNLNVRLMNPDADLEYMHLKALFSGRYFFSGSSNFNIQSVSNNTEMAVLIDDPTFAKTMGGLILKRAVGRFESYDCEAALVAHEREATLARRFLNYFMSMLY